MIKLSRERSKDAVVSSFRGATPRNRLVSLMKQARKQLKNGATLDTVDFEIKSKWSDTKEQLLSETHGKCAYCETSMAAVAFGDVEHYRPKSIYWWLAYVYDNYLASCAICNQRFKSNKFEFSGDPLPPPAVAANTTDDGLKDLAKNAIPDPLDLPAVERFEDLHRAEKPLIPNPYVDDPETCIAWDIIDGTRSIEAVANPEVEGSEAVLDACERIYGINRPELMRRRYEQYEFYKNFQMALQDLPDGSPSKPGIEQIVATMSEPSSQYAAMIRFFEKKLL